MRKPDHHMPPNAQKHTPHVLVFAYRPFDIRTLVFSGVIEEMANHVDVTLLVPTNLADGLRQAAGSKAKVLALPAGLGKSRGDNSLSSDPVRCRRALNAMLALAAELTYASGDLPENASGRIMRSEVARSMKAKPWGKRLLDIATLAMANAGGNCRCFRRAIQLGYRMTCHSSGFDAILRDTSPDLLVTASAGLALDGQIMCAAKALQIPIATVVQSWDKTSTKGYPPVHPDYMLVWSHLTRQEAIHYLDMPPEHVFVDGAPGWDSMFNASPSCTREEFLHKHGLAADTANLIYVSLGYPAYHDGNLCLVKHLVEGLQTQAFPPRTGLLLRPHPAFHDEPQLLHQYHDIARGLPHGRAAMPIPARVTYGADYFLDARDGQDLIDMFHHCDACVEVASTQMIEAAIFDKPIIDIAFGTWKTSIYDIPLKQLTLQHLERIFATNGVTRVFSPEHLAPTIAAELASPQRLKREREQMVQQEVSVNRGTAAAAVAARLCELAEHGLGGPRE